MRAWLIYCLRTRLIPRQRKALQAMGREGRGISLQQMVTKGFRKHNLGFPRLIDAIECKADFRELRKSAGNVYIVDSLDVIPSPFPSGCALSPFPV